MEPSSEDRAGGNKLNLARLVLGVILVLILAACVYDVLSVQRPVKTATIESSSSAFTPEPAVTNFQPMTPPASSQLDSTAKLIYQYNAQGQLQSIIYPDRTVYTYAYDSHGSKIRETDRKGKT